MQQDDYPGKKSCGDKPRSHGESEDLPDVDPNTEHIKACRIPFSMQMFTYCEAYDEESE